MSLKHVEQVVADINREHGTSFVLDRPLVGGYQNGAYALRTADNPVPTAVLKWSDDPGRAGLIRRAQTVVAAARDAGWPTPAWLYAGATPSGYPFQVQEFAAGSHTEQVTLRLVRGIVPVLDIQAGLRPDTPHDWSAYDHAVVYADESAFSSTLTAYSPAGAEFVETVRSRLAPYRGIALPTTDLVHGDLNPGNVLLTGDRVSALVDAEALGKGTRFHDLAGLLVYVLLWDSEPGVAEELMAYARLHAAPGELEISFAACLLGILEFIARRNPDDPDVDVKIRLATELVRRLEGPSRSFERLLGSGE